MPFYREHVYPHLVMMLGNPRRVREIRERIVPSACGTVLEIGVGPGPNFAYYDRQKVAKVYALEPNAGMLRLAEKARRKTELDVQFLEIPGERIPLADGSVDSVLSTFTFCSIPGVTEAIRGIRRVLRPGGRLIFLEHGRSPDPSVRRWQKRWEPVFYHIFDGCHLTRDVPALITQSGFQLDEIESAYLPGVPKSWAHCWWGIARPQPG